ncbi:macrolide ABC transporter ATP-binding protein [Oceanidesulfovibrio indonesiensis]|uniref:Macrolide ABC transporter ATP-binding protein n=1 Tax=Oceanidesulfovibrio indonesiensis TaxID=54767 RepID=A0A7M3MD85_9BACT|nr:ABC transporter ATP-binding protein [Oceanidesulfovibrio indonesiensis]TVM16176.1 macrolide ABC transporter ATP-binding protein [Oceanidesulfovibrio indonesiensis]
MTDTARPLITLEGIEKSYPRLESEGNSGRTTVLHDIDITVNTGEFLALQGTSGSGKSTLLHIIGLLDRPTAGRYSLEGRDVSGLPDDARSELRNRKIGFVFQSFYLVPYITALDNVMMPGLYGGVSHSALTRRARELMEMVGLSDRMGHKPSQLSGGQQQRVALARALVNEPSLVLADEPTGQLDSRTSGEIMSLLAKVHEQGATVILVTHDEDTASYAERRLRMEDGSIVGDGAE